MSEIVNEHIERYRKELTPVLYAILKEIQEGLKGKWQEFKKRDTIGDLDKDNWIELTESGCELIIKNKGFGTGYTHTSMSLEAGVRLLVDHALPNVHFGYCGSVGRIRLPSTDYLEKRFGIKITGKYLPKKDSAS